MITADAKVQALLLRLRDLLRARTPAAVAEAVKTAEAGLAQHPAHALLRLASADAFKAAGDVDRAIAETRRAIELGVGMPEASFNLGALHAGKGETVEAIAWFERAVRERPNYSAALNNLGELHHASGRLEAAREAFLAALAATPGFHAARFNLANVYRVQGQLAEAEREFSAILAADPRSRPAWSALAAVQRSAGRLDDAARSLASAIRIDPAHSVNDRVVLGSVLAERGDIASARDVYAQARQIDSRNLQAALGELLTLPQVYESVEHLQRERRRYADGLERIAGEFRRVPEGLPPDRALALARWSNFYLGYQGEDDRALQSRYGDWLAGYLDSVDPALRAPLPRRAAGQRIRVGFASRYFTNSTIGMYFGRWIRDLDRTRFEVVLYDLQVTPDEVTAALAAAADRHVPLRGRGRPVAEVARAIRADSPDILIYPELGMDDLGFVLAAMRLAPVQCCAWGHPVTPGHPSVDFYLSVSGMEPPEAQAHYRERLVGLPGIGTSYPRPPAVVAGQRDALGLPAGRKLLCCPQSLFKIHPDSDALIARVAAAVPDSTLVLFTGRHPLITDRFMRRLGQAFAAAGRDIRADTLVLPVMPREDYLRFTAACDLMLDTPHWSGGNTSLDALSCALPVVTLPGRFMRGRQSMAMLRLLELRELIATDPDDYVRVAVDIATQPERRADLSARIGERSARLFDDASPIRALEDFIERTVRGSQ